MAAPTRGRAFLPLLGITITIFSGIAFVYVMGINFLQPQWLPLPITHLTFWPFNERTDVIGIAAFVGMLLGFYLWINTSRAARMRLA